MRWKPLFIVDSMPLEICKTQERTALKFVRKMNFRFPSKGYCASQSSYYYGYKLHAVCSVSGVFQSFDISTASIHDIHIFARYQASNEQLYVDWRQGLFIHLSANRFVQLCEYKAGYPHEKTTKKKLSKTKYF